MSAKRFHTALSLGETRHVTPDGFLVCEDVPMARVGTMMYGPDETPIPSRDGITGVQISRDAEEVFAPKTILSMIGKPVTSDHPPENVSPGNWKDYAVGTVISAKRGVGIFADMLIGDIMITDADAIQEILAGKKEVSCGYDADYDEVSPGVGRQKNIYYNHLALVDKGRCGPRCAIGDYQPEEISMAPVRAKRTVLQKLQRWLDTGEEIKEELEKSDATADEDESVSPSTKPGGDVHIHISAESGKAAGKMPSAAEPTDATEDNEENMGGEQQQEGSMDPAIDARFKALETGMKTIASAVQKLCNAGEDEENNAEEMAEEAPPATDMRTVRNSAVFQDSFRETAMFAEIIVPGVSIPTFDAKAKPGKGYDAICSFRKTVLDLAWNQPSLRGVVTELNGGKTLDTKCMTCDAVRGLFRSLGVIRKNANNGRTVGDTRRSGDERKKGVMTIAELNKFNAERNEKNRSKIAS